MKPKWCEPLENLNIPSDVLGDVNRILYESALEGGSTDIKNHISYKSLDPEARKKLFDTVEDRDFKDTKEGYESVKNTKEKRENEFEKFGKEKNTKIKNTLLEKSKENLDFNPKNLEDIKSKIEENKEKEYEPKIKELERRREKIEKEEIEEYKDNLFKELKRSQLLSEEKIKEIQRDAKKNGNNLENIILEKLSNELSETQSFDESSQSFKMESCLENENSLSQTLNINDSETKEKIEKTYENLNETARKRCLQKVDKRINHCKNSIDEKTQAEWKNLLTLSKNEVDEKEVEIKENLSKTRKKLKKVEEKYNKKKSKLEKKLEQETNKEIRNYLENEFQNNGSLNYRKLNDFLGRKAFEEALMKINSNRSKAKRGEHLTDKEGKGIKEKVYSKTEKASKYETPALFKTLRRSQIRNAKMGRLGLDIEEEDLVKYGTKRDTPYATVMLIDSSGSMSSDGKMKNAKKAALALHYFQKTRYKRDRLHVLSFDSKVSEIESEKIVELSGNGSTYTDLALKKSREILKEYPPKFGKMIYLITDGGANNLNSALKEAKAGVEEGIYISEIALDNSEDYLGKAERLADASKGTMIQLDQKNMSEFIIQDYGRKRNKIRGERL